MKSHVEACAVAMMLGGVPVSAQDAEPQSIVVSRLGPSEAGVYVSQADGTGERKLAESMKLAYDPTWSPAGDWIAFTSEEAGSPDLYRMKPDGTGLEQLTDHAAYDDQAAFSPDGQRLVFVTTRAGGSADLWTLDVAARKATPLTAGPGGDFRPSWSPDGNWIAFSSDRESTLPSAKGRWETLQVAGIYVIRPDGTGLRRLGIADPSRFCGSPKWSGDSRRVIAYCMTAEETWTYRGRPARPGFPVAGPTAEGETQLVSIEVATGEVAPVAAGPGVKLSPAWLPSGEIGYARKDRSVKGVFYGTGTPGPAGVVASPSWSPDGARLVYHRVLSSATPDWQKTYSRDSRYDLFLSHWLPAFDPAGERFVATRALTGALELVDNATRKARPIFQEEGKMALAAQWSAQGDSVVFGVGVFFAGATQNAQVVMTRPDGSGLRQLTAGANNNGFPSLSPDGRRLVYRTSGPEGSGLRIKSLVDDTVTTLTTEHDNFPLWSPRGDLISFVRRHEGDFEIFTIRPDGQALRRLTHSPGNEAHAAWSPDGEWILFTSSQMGFKDEALFTDSPQPYGEIFAMRYDGSDVHALTDNQWEEGTPAWQPKRPASQIVAAPPADVNR